MRELIIISLLLSRDWDALKKTLKDVVALVVDELLQPDLNKLTPKSD